MKSISRILLLLGIVVGGFGVVQQLIHGLVVTALREPVVWGLYIVMFIFFLGLGAGAVTITSWYLGFKEKSPENLRVALTACVLAFTSLAIGGMFVGMDLGSPERAYLFLFIGRWQSPLIADFYILNFLLLVSVIDLVVLLRRIGLSAIREQWRLLVPLCKPFLGEKPVSVPPWATSLAKGMTVLTPILYLITARVFASVPSRDFWHHPLLGMIFLVSSGVSALAAILLWLPESPAMQNTLTRIRQWLAGLIVLDIVVSLVPYLTIRSLEYHRHNDALFHFSLPVAAELIIGLFIPLLMLVFARSIKKELPAVLILLGVVLKRWHIVIPGLTHHALPYPPAHYVPNSIEWLICLCFVSLFGLMMSFLNELPTLIPDNQNS